MKRKNVLAKSVALLAAGALILSGCTATDQPTDTRATSDEAISTEDTKTSSVTDTEEAGETEEITTEGTSEVASSEEVSSEEAGSEDAGSELPGPTADANPVAYYGELIAKDSKLYGAKTDEPVQVTGMSFFWSNWSQKYYTSDYVDYMVDDYGCEIVRCSYGIQDNGVPYDTSCEPLIDDVIDEAIARGVYVIVDWHSHGAHSNPDEAKAYFGKLAEKYGEYDNVIFELYNEPKGVDWSTIKEYAEEVIPVIREHSDNLIVVGTPNWSQNVDKAAADPIDAENIAYTLHFYAGTHKEWLRQTADKAMKAGISLMITEWGSVAADGNGAIDKESTEEWFKWIDENQLSSCNWAINDKDETSSIFKSDSKLSDTGLYIKDLIAQRTADAPWRAQ